MKLRNYLLTTLGLWILIVVAFGYWRMFYAWRWGSVWVFMFQYVPALTLSLAIVVLLELLYFRRKTRS